MKDTELSGIDERLDVLINEHALERLDDILPNLTDRELWYQVSYPQILQHFRDSKGSSDPKAHVLRIACVSSWIPAALKSNLDPNAIERIQYFEKLYENSTLWEIGSESYLGGIHQKGIEKYHGFRIFQVQSDHRPYLMKDYLEPVTFLLNSSNRWKNTVGTTSKYLHFMLPNLFPILDSNIAKILFDTELVDDVRYSIYTFALQDIIPRKKFVLKYANEKGLSPLKVIDNILFHVPIVFYK